MWLVTAYVLLILAGIVIFRSSAVMVGGNGMSIPRAVFTSINAATLTGFPQAVAVDQYLPPGQWMVLALMCGGTFFTLTASTLAVARIIGMELSVKRVCGFALLAQLLALLAGGAMFLTPDRSAFESVFLAASAFGNCGLIIGPKPLLDESRTMIALLPLAVIGGLGLPVLIDLFDRLRGARARLSAHSRIVFAGLALAFVMGTFTSLCFTITNVHSAIAIRAALVTSSSLALNARTAGFPLESIYGLPRAMPWICMMLMFIGAAPAGTAGGLKVTTLYVLIRDARRSLRGEMPGRGSAVALAWTAALILIVMASLLALASSQAQLPGDRLLLVVVSAACNVGLSPDPLSINETNGFVLSAAMLLGRLFPIAILWWQARVGRDEVAVG